MSKPQSVESYTRLIDLSLVHYGSSKYDPKKVVPISDHHWIKPHGGFWTSPIGSEYGWKEWCHDNDFATCDTANSFCVGFTGNVLVIDCLADLKKLVWVEPSIGWHIPLFEPLIYLGVDAIHLTVKGERDTRFSRPRSLYGWDCESVLVMNPSCIDPN